MRVRIEDKIWTTLVRCNFFHLLISGSQAFHGLNPANIGVAVTTSKDVVSGNQNWLLCPVQKDGYTDPLVGARQVPRIRSLLKDPGVVKETLF